MSYGGIIQKTYHQIPLSKIYYVKKKQNIISKNLSIYSVNIGTIAHTHKIPGLTNNKADKLCNMVIQFQYQAKSEGLKSE